jgi:hypothetical protein|tara:strand:+ start:3508 stop:4593 length:1086 start_codon:yes stop_codon:yes gene_type:complete
MIFRIFTAMLSVIIFCFSAPVIANDESWTDRLAFKSDLRLRYEGIEEEGERNRDRMRIRARIGLDAKIQEDLSFVFRLATGGDNPVSTNQTLDGSFSTKDIGVDLAYVDWQVNDVIAINAGKMKNPMFRAGSAPMIWDGDLNPEGIAAKFGSGMLFGAIAAFSVDERSTEGDSLLYAMQAGAKVGLGDASKLTVGLSYFTYTNTIGYEPFYKAKPRGNSVEGDGDAYIYGYKNIEIFGQFDTEVMDWPLRLYVQYTKNNEVSVEDTAYSFGATLGSVKKKGDMQFVWIYQDIQADALIAAFNDSDFGGGGTDSKGHLLRTKYGFSKKVALGGTFFLNQIDRFQGTEHDYNRVQIDLEFKFN